MWTIGNKGNDGEKRTLKVPALLNCKGQIFPFLIMILVIMIILVAAFINTSQVNLRKLGTMNAADAGALAGAAQIASAANAIADLNVNEMLPTYVVAVEEFGTPGPLLPGVPTTTFSQFHQMAQNAIYLFHRTMIMGYKGVQQAGGAGLHTALSNMPIDEAQRRLGSPEGMMLPSNLQAMMQLKDVYTEGDLDFNYAWRPYWYNLTEQKQKRRILPEEINIHVEKPQENALEVTPMPLLPLVTHWHMVIPPCLVFDACITCNVIGAAVATAYAETFFNMITSRFTLQTIMFQSPFFSFMEQQNMTGALTLISSLMSLYFAFPLCFSNTLLPFCLEVAPNYVLVFCVFMYPVPFLISLKPSSADIEVTARRFSPPRDLGLFKMYYPSVIQSSARAGISRGTVWKPGSYDIKMD